ncbi:hypothetical protein Hamer_G006998, partial [Homarus americanus]
GWTYMTDKNEAFYVIYLEFKKALDSVPHHRTVNKEKDLVLMTSNLKFSDHISEITRKANQIIEKIHPNCSWVKISTLRRKITPAETIYCTVHWKGEERRSDRNI